MASESDPAQRAEPADEGGDPACWLNHVCPECGAFVEETRCPRCGAELPADG